jgi:hypothetical protein
VLFACRQVGNLQRVGTRCRLATKTAERRLPTDAQDTILPHYWSIAANTLIPTPLTGAKM